VYLLRHVPYQCKHLNVHSLFETLTISLADHSRVDRRQKTGPSWLIPKLQLCFRGRSGKLASGGRTGSLHSLGVAIARIIFVLIIMAVIVFSELMNINLVKHGTKQVLVNALRAMKSMFDGIDLRLTPLDDKDIRVDEVRRRAHVHYWRERGKIDHHPLVPAAQLVK